MQHSEPARRPWIHAVLAVLTVAVAAIAVAASWRGAARSENGQRPRLRWYVAATAPVPAGTRIAAGHLQRRIARLPEDSSFVPAPGRVTDKYTAVALNAGDRLIPECVSAAAPVFPSDTFAVVPVQLKREHTVALQPGMRVALARETHYVTGAVPDSGLVLLALDGKAGGTTVTALVAVRRGDSTTQKQLSNAEWRAIALHAAPELNPPAAARLPRPCAEV